MICQKVGLHFLLKWASVNAWVTVEIKKALAVVHFCLGDSKFQIGRGEHVLFFGFRVCFRGFFQIAASDSAHAVVKTVRDRN